MNDDEFVDLVRRALELGYRVYVRNLPHGQVAVQTIRTDGQASLAVSSEFRTQVKALRGQLRTRRAKLTCCDNPSTVGWQDTRRTVGWYDQCRFEPKRRFRLRYFGTQRSPKS